MTRMNTLALTLVAATLAACGGSGGYDSPVDPPPGDRNTIAATSSLAFGPATLTVNAGEAVTFAFGSVAHNVYFDTQTGAPASIEGNNANVSITRTFTTAGSYRYSCHIHPSMQGTVVVR